MQSFRARATPFIEKSVGSADAVERLKIDGHLAYWITGAHGFAFQAKDSVGYEQQRLSDRVLLLERDGVLLRVEGAISRDRAVEIAKSRSPLPRLVSSASGPAASSPAARSGGPCAAAPSPTARRDPR